MKKQVKKILGKENYLLGTDHDGEKVWLLEPSWDCEWYWGLGYVETYNRRYSDIDMHTHFDSLFLNKNIFNSFVDYFEETTLDSKGVWQLLEYMKTLYILQQYAEMLYTGGAHITKNGCAKLLKNDEERNRINDTLIPEIWVKIAKLLGDEEAEPCTQEKQ